MNQDDYVLVERKISTPFGDFNYAEGDIKYGDEDMDMWYGAGGEGVTKILEAITKNKEIIGAAVGTAAAVAGGIAAAKRAKALAKQKAQQQQQQNQQKQQNIQPQVRVVKSNTITYVLIGASVLVAGVITFLLVRK
jgi:hypothetical protein